MKPRTFIAVIVSAVLGLGIGGIAYDNLPPPRQPAPTESERALLWAIAQVESGGDYAAISTDGKHLWAYQLSEDLFSSDWWWQHQDQAAFTHLRHLEKTPGILGDVKQLALAWRGKNDPDYAQRVDNLYTWKTNQRL